MNKARFTNLVVLLTIIWLSSRAYADVQENKYYENVDWVKSAQKHIPARAKGKLNAGDYCAEPGCESDIARPEQANLTADTMKSKKQNAMSSNSEAQAVKAGFNNGRPEVKNDPAYEFALIAQDNAYEITHGISNQYVDCDNATQCAIDYIPKLCRQPTNVPVPCTKTPIFTVVTSPVIYTCSSGWSLDGYMCSRTVTECRYDAYNQIRKGGCAWDSDLWRWDGKSVHPSSGYYLGPYKAETQRSCGRRDRFRQIYGICGPVPETKRADLTCQPGYSLSGGNCIRHTITWQTDCTLLSECKIVSELCVEGKETRMIDGVPVTLDCWKYQVDHQCERLDTCSELPDDCTTEATYCSAKQNGVCIEEELKKSCPEKRCSSTNLMCGEDSFCLDGDCYGEMPTPSNEFNESAAALAALAKAAEGLGDPPKIFTGQGQSCSKKIAGIANCCKDGGWGTDLGLASCSEQEKALGKAKEDKLTIYLGSYCAEKILGKCIRRKQTYCLFDSLLARIIQQQGVQGQLGLSLGSPKSPVCGAITPEQMQQINFEDIDFSDFFSEMNSNTDLPSAREIQERISSAMGG
ncbi:type-F conjugative transfer system mating-pair stabilization protein TraN [Vibrio sp. THAF190c]|uniref:type-F conjugative transfer system mating-pair stabilization protein TraN n=1 Tax=Vibrio sp. THAF190c TaxID=2587865 RepID=UPI0012697312|nr:type-F conjugative transfer system mating-pair stabilization protein TraN [Vibrio sp. THAF190c]QFT13615.1 conjugal transfer mating pair stabilization protein TraN [Vibrio sp. THAF190c]